jgi:mRNA deadenylase 3'-5' endonuclease subunit Ccr4
MYNNKRHFERREHKVDEKFKNKNFPFNYRTWVHEIQINNSNGEYIRVVTYNILADSLLSISTQIHESEFENLPHLLWENRRASILEELKELDGDVLCLQEFEKDELMIEELGKLGYDVKNNYTKYYLIVCI